MADNSRPVAEPLQKGAQAAQAVRGAVKTGKAIEMARWSYENGYWCSGSGSYHALIPAAAKAWGLNVEGCTASDGQKIADALTDGKLVVAIMLKGHFTSSGHFIVLRGVGSHCCPQSEHRISLALSRWCFLGSSIPLF